MVFFVSQTLFQSQIGNMTDDFWKSFELSVKITFLYPMIKTLRIIRAPYNSIYYLADKFVSLDQSMRKPNEFIQLFE